LVKTRIGSRAGTCSARTESFPAASHDDQVDAMAQALARLSRPAPRVRVLGGSPPVRRGLLGAFR
jgi:hypothetical protein